jgi:hypothetical protein
MTENLVNLLEVNNGLLVLVLGLTLYKGFRAFCNNGKDERDELEFRLLYRFTEIFLWPWVIVQVILVILIYWYGWSA